jgi:hypothetical protein
VKIFLWLDLKKKHSNEICSSKKRRKCNKNFLFCGQVEGINHLFFFVHQPVTFEILRVVQLNLSDGLIVFKIALMFG